MNAFGSDRVRAGDGEQRILLSRLSKGWTPRTPKSLTRSEFPGTAVLWGEEYFEVVEADALPQGGVRYLLEPWREHLTMRVSDRYDAESEAARIEAHRAELMRLAKRKSANTLAVFTGHLPHAVQEHLASELGINPMRLTMISAFFLMLICGPPFIYCIALNIGGYPMPMPLWLFGLCAWWTSESIFRFNIAFAASRSFASLEGYIGYTIFHLLAPGRSTRVSAFDTVKGSKATSMLYDAAPEDVALQDALVMREALVTLLPPAEQEQIAVRTGYDYRRRSVSTAIFISVVAVVGVVSSITTLRGGRSFSAVVSLLVAGALLVEQFVRIAALRKGPAGSVLAVLVRPFTRKLMS